MGDVVSTIGEGLKQSFLMAYQVWWALVLGFAISAIVQACAPRSRIEHALSGSGPRPVAVATGLGAASSSCSYAAIAIAKSLFQKGASAATALAFQFASTNLVWELGLVMWVLLGWQFTLAEFVGGILLIVLRSSRRDLLLLLGALPARFRGGPGAPWRRCRARGHLPMLGRSARRFKCRDAGRTSASGPVSPGLAISMVLVNQGVAATASD